jgi:hypothetical protein
MTDRLCRLGIENATGHSWRTNVNSATKEIRHSCIVAVGTIPTDLIKKLDIASFGMPVSTTLTELGSDGILVAAVGLQLSPDNRQVQRGQFLLCGQFLLRGNLTKEPIEIQANILWPSAEPDIFLTITLSDGAAFLFNSSNLCSDLIVCEDYSHSFPQNNRVIVPSEWKDKGVGETAMRAVCHLDKTSNGRLGPCIKVTTLIFPRSVDKMIQLCNATQSPAWHQGVGEHLQPFSEGQGMGRAGLPTLPARHGLRGRTQHPAPRRAAVPCGRYHAVGEAAYRLHEAESPAEAVGEGAGQHQ